MRIAIVDDISSERRELHEKLNKLLCSKSLTADILEYESGADFISSANCNPFGVVFMDIYMNKENGIETAKILREFDKNCILIFTTASTDHALEGFKVRAFQYLVKPYSDEDLSTVFYEIAEKLPESEKYIDIHIVGGNVRLRLSEIVYAEHYQHRIHIHTSNGKTTVTRKTFSDFMSELDCDERFFVCSRGVIINLEHAKDFDGTAFTLNSGDKIAVSRSIRKSARIAFGDFVFKRRKNNG